MSDGVALNPQGGVFVPPAQGGVSVAQPSQPMQITVPAVTQVVLNYAEGAQFIFTQAAPAASWVVNHNLGRKPVVTILSVGGVEIDAGITHASDNQFIVDFNIPTAGQTICT